MSGMPRTCSACSAEASCPRRAGSREPTAVHRRHPRRIAARLGLSADLHDIDAVWWRPDVETLPVGAPFRPGVDPLPAWQHAWAVVKDRWGRPAHGDPREALERVIVRVPEIGPNDALGYVLYTGLTYNTIFAARGVPISVFDLHDRDLHVAGSGAVVLVAALGSEAARQARLRVGELRVLYPGVSDLLSPRAGEDPMHADFKIQGYETPDGSFAQFVRCQAPQLLDHSERLTLAEGSSFMLDLETVAKALYDVARVQPGERVFVEGAAGGTGTYAVASAALRGARVIGLVSTEDKGRLVVARGARAWINRKALGLADAFIPVPTDPAERRAWRAAGERLTAAVRERNDGALVDVVVSSVGRDPFGRMVDLLAPGGRLVFYGATSGYTLAFLGKPGAAGAAEMLRRVDLRPNEGVLVYYGTAADAADEVGSEAIAAALAAGARVVAVTRLDAQAAQVRASLGVAGVVSLETLARSPGFRWPETMPDYDTDPESYRAYQDQTLKPFGQAVGRVLACADNPRGHPDVVVERAGRDTLGISTFLARPHTGRIVYLESTAGQRLSFYAPNVWMHQKRVVCPSFAILGSHLSNAHQAAEVVRLLDSGALAVHPPAIERWDDLAEANQAIHENRHAGTIVCRVGATPALDAARTARQVYEAWGSRFVDGQTVRVRLDPVGADWVALITIDVPPANTIGRATLDDLERALDALEAEPRLRAAVLDGAGTMFVAGADVRQLRAFATAADVEAFARRAQRLFTRIARSRAPIVAAVDGYALGGGNELQMACAYRVASARAELGQPEINLHVIPGFGGTQMLPRLAVRHALGGRGQMYALLVQALAVLLDGRRRDARAARALGLVDEVAPADALSHALGLARRIADGTFAGALWSPLGPDAPTLAFPNVERDGEIQRLLEHHTRISRIAPARAILNVVRVGLTEGLDAGLALEAREFGRLVASDNGRAGIDRFLARRSLPLPPRREVAG
jgi:acrylyl-CoA reductase (NADPH)/3-hydroxypropionyl-CoA dehydratase/3-hydroxypropionyl-CoA synthetase